MSASTDDMLDGSACSGCGQWFDDVIEGHEPPGEPRTCTGCILEEEDDWEREKNEFRRRDEEGR
jgi:hypothetical protein